MQALDFGAGLADCLSVMQLEGQSAKNFCNDDIGVDVAEALVERVSAIAENPEQDGELQVPRAFLLVTHTKKRAYLIALCLTPSFRRAAQIAGICSKTGFNYRTDEADTAFQDAFKIARQLGIEAAENEAWERATNGWNEPVFGNIQEPVEIDKASGDGTRIVYRNRTGIVGHINKRSDTMLIFMLKGAKPETYRERVEHSGNNGGPIQLQLMLPDNGRRRLGE